MPINTTSLACTYVLPPAIGGIGDEFDLFGLVFGFPFQAVTAGLEPRLLPPDPYIAARRMLFDDWEKGNNDMFKRKYYKYQQPKPYTCFSPLATPLIMYHFTRYAKECERRQDSIVHHLEKLFYPTVRDTAKHLNIPDDQVQEKDVIKYIKEKVP